MRVRPLLAFVVAVLAADATLAGLAAADGDADPAVATIGDEVVRTSRLKRDLAGVPAFELSALGTTKLDILHRYVDEAIVRPQLLAVAAKNKGALDDRAVKIQLSKVLATALLRKELGGIGEAADIPAADVKAYYEAHVDAYKTPARIRLLHIALGDATKAAEVLAAVKKDGPTREGWRDLVAKNTLDPTNKYSDGSLGWVSADGKTEEPKVVVPMEIVNAGFALEDGKIAPAPIEATINGVKTFHVLWRTHSTPALVRTLAQEEQTIRMLLFEQKRRTAYESLVARLHGGDDITFDVDLLPLVTIDVGPRPAIKSH